MSEPQLPLFEPDEATLARDDALLDALGGGTLGVGDLPGDDTLAMAMLLWREELSDSPKIVAAERIRRKRRRVAWSIIAAALAVALGSGATVAAASTAEPGSPFFPITRRIFKQQASTASAEAAKERIAEARTAVGEQDAPQAKRLLEEAERLIDSVTSLLEKQSLIDQLERVRALLNALLGGKPVPTPAPTGAPQPTPSGIDHTPGPTPSPSPGGLLPLPLPTISLPPLLPSILR